MAIQTGSSYQRSPVQTVPDWNACCGAARNAFKNVVNQWIRSAQIRGGTVNASEGDITAGALVSDTDLSVPIFNAVRGVFNASDAIASVFRDLLSDAWKAWAYDYRLHLPAAFPSFVAWPGPQAPATPAVPGVWVLWLGFSGSEYRLSKSDLASRILSKLRPLLPQPPSPPPAGETLSYARRVTAADPVMELAGGSYAAGASPQRASLYSVPIAVRPPDDAVNALAEWVHNSFRSFKQSAVLRHISGSGPVPSYAPPYVPTGPVVGGTLSGDNVLSGSF